MEEVSMCPEQCLHYIFLQGCCKNKVSKKREKEMAKTVSNEQVSHIASGSDDVLPVLIVGAGPVGLTLAILLTKLGVKCGIIEKRKTFSQHPQAHIINNRSMEIFRKLDNLELEIQNLHPPVDQWRNFVYCTSLFGSMLGSVDLIEPKDLEQVVSPTFGTHLSQYKLNKLLLENIQHLGFHVRMCEDSKSPTDELIVERNILMGHECTSIEATDRGIMVDVQYLKNGEKVKRNILCSILVGADGVGSVVRKLQGIEMIGDRDMQRFLSVHFKSTELGQYLLNERPGMLYFIINVEAIGILVAHNLSEGEFVMQIPLYPPQQTLKDFSLEVYRELIFNFVGQKLKDIDVLGIKSWVMHAEVAEKFVSSNNRVILVGDAAHRFPPAGGFGMNTGIQDAHNLAWKIASLVKGVAPPSILRTYETERRPIAFSNTTLSVKNIEIMGTVPAVLGFDPTRANIGLQDTILGGRAQVSDSTLNESNQFESSRITEAKRIFDEGKSLQLQFPAHDIGFRYIDGALVREGDSSQDAPETPIGHRTDYIPVAEAGARLPHMSVRKLQGTESEEKLSTLDLVSTNKVEFLLIIAPLKKSYDLAKAAFKVADEFQVGLKVCVIWSRKSNKGMDGSKEPLLPWENYVDVEEAESPSSLSWWQICKMTEKGAILVRPDDHIAWRTKEEDFADPLLEMEKVFTLILGVEKNHA